MLGRNAARPGGNAQPRGGSYGGRGGQIIQRWGIVEEEICSTEGDTSQVHGETQTQWMLIEEQEGTGNVITVGSLATWPGIVGIGIKQG